MASSNDKNLLLECFVENLELPDSAYEKATERYEDLGAYLGRNGAPLSGFDPHIFPQGSFRLGTAIRPINQEEEYDLDLACKLRVGVNKETWTQEKLKNVLGLELNSYRKERGIQKALEAKHRCWRLEYKDQLSFHMDIVPCIPADDKRRQVIMESMHAAGVEQIIANAVSQTTVYITDDRHPSFKSVCSDWNISNPEGYATWFESRMRPVAAGMEHMAEAQIDAVPLFKRKTPLQRAIQLLKRHRDNWCKSNPDCKPISIIITTLAAQAYNGEADIADAIGSILKNIPTLIRPQRPHVPNPVDPQEDFADRWYKPECADLELERNFKLWMYQAQNDFSVVFSTTELQQLNEQMESKFSLVGTNLSEKVQRMYSSGKHTPRVQVIDPRETQKPWRKSL
jgi:hypothetical protein